MKKRWIAVLLCAALLAAFGWGQPSIPSPIFGALKNTKTILYEQTINGRMPYDGHASRALPNLAAIG